MKKYLIGFAIFLLSNAAMATYNANIVGQLTGVYVYADDDYIYLRLNNQPASHPTCNPSYFVISGDVELARRQMLLSRALAAYLSKENLNIGYDS